MKKRILVTVAVISGLLTVSAFANVAQYLTASISNYKLRVNGKEQALKKTALTVDKYRLSASP